MTHTFKVNDMDRGKKRRFSGSRSSLIQFIPNWEVTNKPVFRKRKDRENKAMCKLTSAVKLIQPRFDRMI